MAKVRSLAFRLASPSQNSASAPLSQMAGETPAGGGSQQLCCRTSGLPPPRASPCAAPSHWMLRGKPAFTRAGGPPAELRSSPCARRRTNSVTCYNKLWSWARSPCNGSPLCNGSLQWFSAMVLRGAAAAQERAQGGRHTGRVHDGLRCLLGGESSPMSLPRGQKAQALSWHHG